MQFLFPASNSTSGPAGYVPIIGVAVILGAAVVAFISSRTNKNDSGQQQQSKIFDPYHSSALLANGCFPDSDKYDTVINAGATFEKDLPSRDAVIALFKQHVIPHQQFHGVPVTTPPGSSNLSWVPVSNGQVDTDAHFIDHSSKSPADTMHITERIMNDTAAIRREGLAKNLPWWRVHLIREPNNAGTLIFSVHHAIGDGISLLTVFGKVLSADAKGTPIDMAALFSPKGRGGGAGHGFFGTLLRPWLWPMALLRSIDFAVCVVELLIKPVGPFDTASPFGWSGGVAAWPPKSDHNVIIPMGVHSLDTIKKIKNASGKGVTVNDVEYALYAGTMRRYLMKHCGWSHDQVASGRFRSMTPFALPHPVARDQLYTHTLANQFAFILAELPMAQRTAKERVVKSNSIWSVFKQRSYVFASFWLTKVASILPISEQQKTTRDLFMRFSVVFSNLPGPAQELYIGGSKISRVFSLYPNVIPQVIVVSVNGEMHYSLVMPPRGKEGTESDVRIAMPKLFQEELDELRAQLCVSE